MTAVSQVPADVLANVRQRWPEMADAWAAHVEAELVTLCEEYQATPGSVLPARYGFVVAADSPTGSLVLRSSPDPHGLAQAAVAATLANLNISPRVYQVVTTDHGTWTVLDRVHPGTALHDADRTTISLEALFAPLAAMHDQPAPITGMPSIVDWLRGRLEDDQLTDLRPGTVIASPGERKAALALLTEVTRDHEPGLCHGDASLGNIIAGDGNRWMYIDPRGMTGESTYDVAVLAVRVSRFYPANGLVPHIADLADVDPHRVRAWMTIAEAARV